MKILNETKFLGSSSGTSTAIVFVLNPDYVRNMLKDNKARNLARVSLLGGFYDSSCFDADYRFVDYSGRQV